YYVLILAGFVFEIIRAIVVKEAPSLLTTIPSISLLVSIDTKIYIYKELRTKYIDEGRWDDAMKEEVKKVFYI
ncbi:MAG: hypothetical protein MJ151_04500, partial [Lachnospiraceae bacterium]|nr:hypothetical protein [Lachnospiraceae bacterium]